MISESLEMEIYKHYCRQGSANRTMRTYQLTRTELQKIIVKGDNNHWSRPQ